MPPKRRDANRGQNSAADWAAKRQAQIENARKVRESKADGITPEHTFQPRRVSRPPRRQRGGGGGAPAEFRDGDNPNDEKLARLPSKAVSPGTTRPTDILSGEVSLPSGSDSGCDKPFGIQFALDPENKGGLPKAVRSCEAHTGVQLCLSGDVGREDMGYCAAGRDAAFTPPAATSAVAEFCVPERSPRSPLQSEVVGGSTLSLPFSFENSPRAICRSAVGGVCTHPRDDCFSSVTSSSPTGLIGSIRGTLRGTLVCDSTLLRADHILELRSQNEHCSSGALSGTLDGTSALVNADTLDSTSRLLSLTQGSAFELSLAGTSKLVNAPLEGRAAFDETYPAETVLRMRSRD
eukprot:TRINITY_DN67472_c0_g1_i1.p1 TRINITY_DN67472_c0_g1~~TRINITY_DN67472_c0_g1_i1.p1  ORF type:complete len:350 (+),score=39.11 TRINITY_DN67472_c0_g1_i1:101-1150(+)